jgi:hypothetical protein
MKQCTSFACVQHAHPFIDGTTFPQLLKMNTKPVLFLRMSSIPSTQGTFRRALRQYPLIPSMTQRPLVCNKRSTNSFSASLPACSSVYRLLASHTSVRRAKRFVGTEQQRGVIVECKGHVDASSDVSTCINRNFSNCTVDYRVETTQTRTAWHGIFKLTL